MTEYLAKFQATLKDIDFSEDRLKRLLGIHDVPLLKPQDLASYINRCQRDNSSLALAACLWLLTIQIKRSEVEDWFNPDMVAELLSRDFLTETSDSRLRSRVDLYPCLGVYVFTDPVFAAEFRPDHVYQLGTDSYVLARVTPRIPGQRALDLCTGSGIHALLAARNHDQVVGIDLNPRALEFSQFNARVNGLQSKCRFLQGDLYAPVGEEEFDLITANPPFVPTPEQDMQLHRGVGETGEEVPQRIVEGLPAHLRLGGTLSMVLDYPLLQSSTYLERLNLWLSQGLQKTALPGWGVAVTHFGTESREEYIKNHLDSSDPTQHFANYSRYLESYDRLGIQAIGFANVFIRRLPQGHPGFSLMRTMAIPMEDVSADIEGWLQALTQTYDCHWPQRCLQCKPALSDRLREIWNPQDRQRVAFEFRDARWSQFLYNDGPALELATRMDGRQTLQELAQSWALQSGQEQSEVEAQFCSRLAWMLENLTCTL